VFHTVPSKENFVELIGMDTSIKDISKFTPVTNVNFRDKNFIAAMEKGDPAIDDYLLSLALCHTIITEHKNGEIIYNVRTLFLILNHRLPHPMSSL
jgi:hypothetical protein